MKKKKNNSLSWNFNTWDIQLGTRVTSIAWSPLSSSPTAEYPEKDINICLCTTNEDRAIKFYSQTFDGTQSQQVVSIEEAHSDHINDSCFSSDPSSQYLATVGDDLTCKIWDVENLMEIMALPLRSAGISVKFHPERSDQLMVAEETGKVKLYDCRSGQVISTLYGDSEVMQCADWNPGRAMQLGAVSGHCWFLWDYDSFPHYETTSIPVNHPSPTIFKFSPFAPNLFATASIKSTTVTVWDQYQLDGPTTSTVPDTVSSLSWLVDEACLVLAVNQQLHFWKIGI